MIMYLNDGYPDPDFDHDSTEQFIQNVIDKALDDHQNRTRHGSWAITAYDERSDEDVSLVVSVATSPAGPEILLHRWALTPTEARELAKVLSNAADCLAAGDDAPATPVLDQAQIGN